MIIKPSRYVLVFGLTMFALLALIFVVRLAFGLVLSTVWVPLVPAVIASMIEGRSYARHTEEPVAGKQAWKAALYMSVLALGLNLMLVAVLLQAQPEVIAAFQSAPGYVLGGVALFFGLWLVTNRFFFTLGIRNERAAARRRA